MTLILGIDPGSQKTGFGIISHEGGRSEYITSGIIRLPRTNLPERLKIIFDSVTEIVEQYCPGELAIDLGRLSAPTLLNFTGLHSSASALRESYERAQPFPHIVIDDL